MTRAVCVTVAVPTVAQAREIAAACGSGADFLELRADHLDPAELTGQAWTTLPEAGRWVFTWRGPTEGGVGGARPAGLLAQARSAGFAFLDVEANALASGDVEAEAVPASMRWVSRHVPAVPNTVEAAVELLRELRAFPAALHKLVLPGTEWADARVALELREQVDATAPVTIFAQGTAGHATRILGAALGNAVTFAAPDHQAAPAPGQPALSTLLSRYRWSQLSAQTAVYGVVGASVETSRSPQMHNAALAADGLDAVYLPLQTLQPEDVFADLRRGRFSGLSVTAPHKAAAARCADRRDDVVERVGAANTLWTVDGRVHAANTDAPAAARLLTELGVAAHGTVAILGAGGAAAAMVEAVRSVAAEPVLFARDRSRARELGEQVSCASRSWTDLTPADHAAVINATPVGGDGRLPKELATCSWSSAALLDLVYGDGESGLIQAARMAGSVYRDGLRFLAEQGADQYRLWTGISRPSAWFLEAAA